MKWFCWHRWGLDAVVVDKFMWGKRAIRSRYKCEKCGKIKTKVRTK